MDRQQGSVKRDPISISGTAPATGGEPLVANYLPAKKASVVIQAIFALWLLALGIESGVFVLHLLSVALLAPYLVLLVECLATQHVTLGADRVVKLRRFFGESTIPAGKVFLMVDSATIRFYHGSNRNLRERITVRRSMVGQEMFDRLKMAAVKRFDILLKDDRQQGGEHACHGSGAGKGRTVAALLLRAYHEAVGDYRVALYLFSLYAIVVVFIVGLSDDFSGIEVGIPGGAVRLVAIIWAAAAYLLLTRVNPPLRTAVFAETGWHPDRSTWNGRLGIAKRSAFLSSLVIHGVGATAFLLFLRTGNLLDFYLYLAVACLFYTDFYPRLSAWQRICQTDEEEAPAVATALRGPLPARRRSLQVSLVLLGTLSVSSYGDSRHYLYKNRKDCLDDWGGNEQDCREPDRSSHYYRSGYWYGPSYGREGTHASRSVGATTVSRGGFGSLGSFHASFGG